MRQLLFTLLALLPTAFALSNNAGRADTARSKLSAAWASPSGKLTHSPELVIPEPQDPTAILLLTDAVQTLGGRIRNCKTNVAFLQGSVNALRTFCNEQAASMGSFPGPVPVVYCSNVDDLSEVAEAGADGLLVQICGGTALQSISDLTSDEKWVETCRAALEAGLQPIPEITLAPETEWSTEDVNSMISSVVERLGSEPVSLVLTFNAVLGGTSPDDAEDNSAEDEEDEQPVPIPPISTELSKKIPILGSVRVMAGDNRLSAESQRFKEAGFAGTFLRSDCVPGFRLQPDLEVVGKFWAACVSDLKSTRSKTFGFRAKNNMGKSAMTQWSNYQKDIIDSGALGDPEDSYSIVDDAAGEYKGFA